MILQAEDYIQLAEGLSVSEAMKNAFTKIMNTIYPVGCYYFSDNSTNPETLFGGTWTQVTDTFIMASGSTYTAGTSGGSASVTLSINQMPSHTHTFAVGPGTEPNAATYPVSAEGVLLVAGTSSTSQTFLDGMIGDTGGTTSVPTLPPYIAVYCFHRTA